SVETGTKVPPIAWVEAPECQSKQRLENLATTRYPMMNAPVGISTNSMPMLLVSKGSKAGSGLVNKVSKTVSGVAGTSERLVLGGGCRMGGGAVPGRLTNSARMARTMRSNPLGSNKLVQ